MSDSGSRCVALVERLGQEDLRLQGETMLAAAQVLTGPVRSLQTPKEAITGTYIDKKCPFTGEVSIRGRILTGKVVSAKMLRTVVIRRECELRRQAERATRRLTILARRPSLRSQVQPLREEVRLALLDGVRARAALGWDAAEGWEAKKDARSRRQVLTLRCSPPGTRTLPPTARRLSVLRSETT